MILISDKDLYFHIRSFHEINQWSTEDNYEIEIQNDYDEPNFEFRPEIVNTESILTGKSEFSRKKEKELINDPMYELSRLFDLNDGKCEYCDRSFNTFSGFQNHNEKCKIFYKFTKNGKTCMFCEESFDKKMIYYHLERKHMDEVTARIIASDIITDILK